MGASSSEPVDFHSKVTTEELNTFVSDNLQPTEEYNKEMRRTVKNICDFLQEHVRPNEIIKGGSMGKGTAVKNKSDIDLVLVLNGVYGGENLKRVLPEKIQMLYELLSREGKPFTIKANSMSKSTFLVKFSVEGTHGSIDVDLLPTFHFGDLNELYNEMRRDEKNKAFYSAALVKQQVDFVSKYPPNVKNLIRLVKYWKKKQIVPQRNERIPSSYVMELITIHLWEKHKHTCRRGRFDTLKAFHCVMKALENTGSLMAYWQEYYHEERIPYSLLTER